MSDDHEAFRDWLRDELRDAGCEIRTLSPEGMAEVTVRRFAEEGWRVLPPTAAEGRRQATEGWERRLRWRLADGSTWEFPHKSYVAAYVKVQRRMERQYGYAPGELQQRLVGPWEPAEQDGVDR